LNNRVGLIAALRNSNFRALWIGQLVSQIGDYFAIIAALVMIQQLTGSTLAVGLAALVSALPQLVFGLIGGVFVDRLNRKWVLVISDLLRAAFVLLLLLVQRADQLWILYLTGFLVSTASVFFNPARNALIPNIVSENMLLTANAMIQLTQVIAIVFGSAVAGLTVAGLGFEFAFLFDSLTFFLSAVAITSIQISCSTAYPKKADPRAIREQLIEGLRFIKADNVILIILVITAIATLSLVAVTILAVAYLDRVLGVGAEGLGLLNSVEGLGMVMGGIFIGRYASLAQSRQIASVGMIILGVTIISFALTPSFTLVLLGATIIGVCIVSARSSLATLTQALVSDDKRGRVESAVATVISITTMAAMILAGVLGDLIGIRGVFIAAGMLTLAAGITAMFALREVEARLAKLGLGL